MSNARRRRQWLEPRNALVATGAIAISALFGVDGEARSACETAFDRDDWAQAATACEALYRDSGLADDGIRVALARIYAGDVDGAAAMAQRLLGTGQAGTAHRILSSSARLRQELPAAAVHATAALALHIAGSADSEIARDAHALATTALQAGAYDAALTAAELSRDASIRARDDRGQGQAELLRADALRLLGDDLAAERALDAAAALLEPYCDRTWVHLKQGLLHLYQEHGGIAEGAFAQSLADAVACRDATVERAARLNLAWIARDTGRPGEAEAFLGAAREVDVDTLYIESFLAVDRGDLAGAAERLAKAASIAPTDADWPWLIAHLRAEVAEVQHRDADAETRYREAIAAVAVLRAANPDNAAYLVAANRLPYEGLFALYARAGRWRDALGVILALDQGDLLRGTAKPPRLGPDGLTLSAAGDEVEIPRRAEAGANEVDVDAVIAAWRGRDLVVVMAAAARYVAPGTERVWRVHVREGEVTGEDLGAAAVAEELAERLIAQPTDRHAAEELGRIVIPPEPAPGRELYVLPAGGVSRIPLAALRDQDGLVVARRPLLRVLELRPRPARARPRDRAVIVVGNPRRDLPAASQELEWVASRLGTTAAAGAHATIDRILAARDADILHVAAHVGEQERARVLHLADGDVAPVDVVRGGVAPRLVVLASCGSAAARDAGGWGSLAAAFLAAGSDVVVATDRSVIDQASADLVRRFYEAGGRDAPARALATAQAAIATSTTSSDWAAFTVLAAPPPVSQGAKP